MSLDNGRKTTGGLRYWQTIWEGALFCHCHFRGPKFTIINKSVSKFQQQLKIQLDTHTHLHTHKLSSTKK